MSKECKTLLIKFPGLSKEWHPTKNGTLTPESVSYGSAYKAWWICYKGHEWQAATYSRTSQNIGCPYCSGQKCGYGNDVKSRFPILIEEWHPTKNEALNPELITPFSNYKVWWLGKCGHEWQTKLSHRTQSGSGCPYCCNQKTTPESSLATNCIELSSQWHPTKNGSLTPKLVVPKSSRKVWWQCSKGHEWEVKIYLRAIKNIGCPYCTNQKVSDTNNLSSRFPEIAKEWHPTKNGSLRPEDITSGTERKVWWLCSNSIKHEWSATVSSRSSGKKGCPQCAQKYTDLEKLVEVRLGLFRYNKYPLINSFIKYRPDFHLSNNLYLNVDGLYWHSEQHKEESYHFKLREAFELENKRIFQFYEDEIYNKWNIVESIINNALDKTNTKINARECIISSINSSQANEFYNTNHLMGSYQAAKHIALIYKFDIVSMMSIRIHENIMEIARYATQINTSVRGGFSKLLSHVIKLCKPTKVISFCDLRYASGVGYEKVGFKRESVTQGWCWTDGVQRSNRLACTAGNGKSEKENAKEKGWYKIYDAGQAKYVLNIN